MELTLYKVYGLAASTFIIGLGIFLLCFKRLDTLLEDKGTSIEKIRKARLLYGTLFIGGGIIMISATLFGWPPLHGYIIMPP